MGVGGASYVRRAKRNPLGRRRPKTNRLVSSRCRYWPRDLPRDSNGFVVGGVANCGAFDAEGNDRGKTGYVVDQLEYHNNFQGGYGMGDISFVRLKTANSGNQMYVPHHRKGRQKNNKSPQIGRGFLLLIFCASPHVRPAPCVP